MTSLLQNNRLKKYKQRGDTIVEVLIAITVVSLVLVGAYTSTNQSTKANRVAQERGEALKLAESQVEYLRNASGKDPSSLTNPPATQLFCYNESGERKDFTSVSAPIPSLDSDNFSNYHVECQNKNNLYNLSIELDDSSFTFTFRVRWDGLISARNEVQLLYRPNLGTLVGGGGGGGPTAGFSDYSVTKPEINGECDGSTPTIIISGISTSFPQSIVTITANDLIPRTVDGVVPATWRAQKTGLGSAVVWAEQDFNVPWDMKQADLIPGRVFTVTVDHPTSSVGDVTDDATVQVCPGGGSGGGGGGGGGGGNYNVTFVTNISGGTPSFTCVWTFQSNGGVTRNNCNSGDSFEKIFNPVPGTYSVTLTVTDSNGSSYQSTSSVTLPR